MSKKARNNDANDLEVSWFDDQGIQHVVLVKSGHELPEKTDGDVPVPAAVRDDLLGRDNWSEVQRQTKQDKGE